VLIELGVVAILAGVVWIGIRVAVGGRVSTPGAVGPASRPRAGAALFRVPDRRRLPPIPSTRGYDRPADIHLPDNRILDPPREIEGRLGE